MHKQFVGSLYFTSASDTLVTIFDSIGKKKEKDVMKKYSVYLFVSPFDVNHQKFFLKKNLSVRSKLYRR